MLADQSRSFVELKNRHLARVQKLSFLRCAPLAVVLGRVDPSAKAVRLIDSLTLIEVTCAGVTELPSLKDARYC